MATKGYVVSGFSVPIAFMSSYVTTQPTLEINIYQARCSRSSKNTTIADLVDLYFIFDVLKHELFKRIAPRTYSSIVILDEPSMKYANALAYLLLRTKFNDGVENIMRTLVRPVWSYPDELELLNFLKYGAIDKNPFTIPISNAFLNYARIRVSPFSCIMPQTEVPRERKLGILGTISQFSFSQCKTNSYACGSISIYALIYAKWRSPILWTYRDIDSIILNGLQKAGRYLFHPERGVENTERQLADMASELQLKVTDIMYYYNLKEQSKLLESLKSIELRPTPAYMLFTTILLGESIGHHTFIYHEGGIWYWLESLRCSEITAKCSDYSPLGGACLRSLEGYQQMLMFMTEEIPGRYWSLIEVTDPHKKLESQSPRAVISTLPVVISPKFIHPVIIQQDTITYEWQIVSQIFEGNVKVFDAAFPYPFDIVLKPKQTLISQYDLPANSFICLRKTHDKSDNSNLVELKECVVNQSPYEDPAIILNTNGIPSLVGDRGNRITYYMRKHSLLYNVKYMLGNDQNLYLSICEDIKKGSELILVKAP